MCLIVKKGTEEKIAKEDIISIMPTEFLLHYIYKERDSDLICKAINKICWLVLNSSLNLDVKILTAVAVNGAKLHKADLEFIPLLNQVPELKEFLIENNPHLA